MAAPTYTFDIASLQATIPGLPLLGALDLSRSIIAGTPIDPDNLTHAGLVVKNLRLLVEGPLNPGVTEEMVQRAELRHNAIEVAHSAAQYAPGLMAGIGALLHRMTQLELTMAQLALSGAMTAAGTANRYILVRNLQNMPTCEPLQKTVEGSGLVLAQAVTAAQGRAALANLPSHVTPAPIGAVPPGFQTNISGYSRADITKLIVFYNQDFGILIGDDETEQRRKLTIFMSHH